MDTTFSAQGKLPYRISKPGKLGCSLSHNQATRRFTETAKLKNNALRVKKGVSMRAAYLYSMVSPGDLV